MKTFNGSSVNWTTTNTRQCWWQWRTDRIHHWRSKLWGLLFNQVCLDLSIFGVRQFTFIWAFHRRACLVGKWLTRPVWRLNVARCVKLPFLARWDSPNRDPDFEQYYAILWLPANLTPLGIFHWHYHLLKTSLYMAIIWREACWFSI